MLDTEKIYAKKGNATKAMNKAVAAGEFKEGEIEVVQVEDVFKVAVVVPLTKKAVVKKNADELRDDQKKALRALVGAKSLEGMTDGEKSNIWFPFAEIYQSSNPSGLPRRSMGGVMRGLINRGLIMADLAGERFGKRVVAVCLTDAGLAIAQVA